MTGHRRPPISVLKLLRDVIRGEGTGLEWELEYEIRKREYEPKHLTGFCQIDRQPAGMSAIGLGPPGGLLMMQGHAVDGAATCNHTRWLLAASDVCRTGRWLLRRASAEAFIARVGKEYPRRGYMMEGGGYGFATISTKRYCRPNWQGCATSAEDL